MPYEYDRYDHDRGYGYDTGYGYAGGRGDGHDGRFDGRLHHWQGPPGRQPLRRGPYRRGPGGGGQGGGQGGIPDGLLMGVLALLLGTTVLTWTATGLAALLAHGSWPEGVSFTRTPMAMRDLAADPRDLSGAWPDVAPSQLSGYGLFWGLFIGQLLILIVLTIFAVGTITRAHAVRAARRAHPTAETATGDVRAQPAQDEAAQPQTQAQPPLTKRESEPAPASAEPIAERPRTTVASPTPIEAPADHTATEAAVPAATAADAHTRVQEAPGAVLVATSDPALWAETKDSRAKLGPVHLFDPGQLCDTPNRLRWSPHHGCADRDTAAARATALLAPLRSSRPIDAEMHTAAETLLRCWLHAAALDDRPFREVHRWALAKSAPSDPVQTLRTHQKAAPGAAGELEATLTSHPERRKHATELVRRALAPLSQLHIRNACTAARADRIALESFIAETGTLYIVGADPELMPILNALTESVVEHGRRVAARSSPGRLDPPLTTVLELPL
ncbi:hypothetical protein [Streptomyces marispadix]|uniref:Type VI secretion protein n=1 Tax=Streptomyces marispadix TaxID=2922868 RepID=A0ABS9SY09_9ACTN|nr:hypothetical protein [Streptomyces marispadix]MCH6161156.1 hypothetical protein [Streptomyces marispadix]